MTLEVYLYICIIFIGATIVLIKWHIDNIELIDDLKRFKEEYEMRKKQRACNLFIKKDKKCTK
jgi:DNA replication protein DnaD